MSDKRILIETDERGRCNLSKVARTNYVYRVDATTPGVLILSPVGPRPERSS